MHTAALIDIRGVPDPIRLCLPSPPSLNSLHRATRQGKIYKVGVARQYEAMVHRQFGHIDPIGEQWAVAVEGAWYRPKMIGDLDNAWKLVGDALQGVAYVNDNQITRLHLTRHDDPKNPRLELVISVVGLRPKRTSR